MLREEDIKTRRIRQIDAFCDRVHKEVDELREAMYDGTMEEEQEAVKKIIAILAELNTQ